MTVGNEVSLGLMKPFMRHTVYVLVLLVLTIQPASAYIDGGTGSMILQLLLGGLAGAAVVAKLYWYKLKTYFRSDKAGDLHEQPKAADE